MNQGVLSGGLSWDAEGQPVSLRKLSAARAPVRPQKDDEKSVSCGGGIGPAKACPFLHANSPQRTGLMLTRPSPPHAGSPHRTCGRNRAGLCRVAGMQANHGHARIAATGRAAAAEAADQSQHSFAACGIAHLGGAERLRNGAAASDRIRSQDIGPTLRRPHHRMRSEERAGSTSTPEDEVHGLPRPPRALWHLQ